jgi:phosphoenolpyruvate synthase/pyruvate phosphate dikinase
VTLANVGSKGASLARLAEAGLQVPGGFHVHVRCALLNHDLLKQAA